MKAISIMYHDIVKAGEENSSGFVSADANLYKVKTEDFAEQLDKIAAVIKRNPANVTENNESLETPFYLTFDDGGRSAYSQTAPLLKKHNWRGHFFVATDFIDTPTFLSSAEIREMVAENHIVGSHSASHPLRMASLSEKELRKEWETSVGKLSDIVGFKISTASVPGGHFSRKVAEASAKAGIKKLFTSEPTTKVYQIDGTMIIGRYAIQKHTPTETIVRISSGDFSPRAKQFLLWNAKKIVKKIGGENYLKIRKWLLAKG